MNDTQQNPAPQFYFISYTWHRHGGEINYAEAVIKDEHPVDWLLRVRESNHQERTFAGMGISFWSEITEEQYEKWDGEVG